MLLEYWCSWMKCREILFRQKYRKSILSFFICNKVSKSIRVVTYFEVGREACSSQINASATTSTKTAFEFLRHLKAGERGTGHWPTSAQKKMKKDSTQYSVSTNQKGTSHPRLSSGGFSGLWGNKGIWSFISWEKETFLWINMRQKGLYFYYKRELNALKTFFRKQWNLCN